MTTVFAAPSAINGRQVETARGFVVFTMRDKGRYNGEVIASHPNWRRIVQREKRKARMRRKKRRGWA